MNKLGNRSVDYHWIYDHRPSVCVCVFAILICRYVLQHRVGRGEALPHSTELGGTVLPGGEAFIRHYSRANLLPQTQLCWSDFFKLW